MNKRRKLVIALGASAFVTTSGSFAQQPGSMPRIGLLWLDTGSASQNSAAFREGLRAQGYVEGKNIQIEDRFLVKDYEQFADAAVKLASQKIDVIVFYGSTATRAASKATSSIPIVMISGGDPVKLGVAASLSKPGGNVTGISSVNEELSGKRLEILKEIVPGMHRVAVILYPESSAGSEGFKNYEFAARVLNLEVRAVEIHTSAEIGPAIAGIAQMNVQAIAVMGSTLLTAHKKEVVAAVAKVRLPSIYSISDFPYAGGLLAYASNLSDRFRQAAIFVSKILKGTKPAVLPIEQPTKFEMVVNLKTAKLLGIKIPQSILLRADKVIE